MEVAGSGDCITASQYRAVRCLLGGNQHRQLAVLQQQRRIYGFNHQDRRSFLYLLSATGEYRTVISEFENKRGKTSEEWNAYLGAVIRIRGLAAGSTICHKMENSRLADANTYANMLDGCMREGDKSKGLFWVERMLQGKPFPIMGCARVVRRLARHGQVGMAAKVYAWLRSHQVSNDGWDRRLMVGVLGLALAARNNAPALGKLFTATQDDLTHDAIKDFAQGFALVGDIKKVKEINKSVQPLGIGGRALVELSLAAIRAQNHQLLLETVAELRSKYYYLGWKVLRAWLPYEARRGQQLKNTAQLQSFDRASYISYLCFKRDEEALQLLSQDDCSHVLYVGYSAWLYCNIGDLNEHSAGVLETALSRGVPVDVMIVYAYTQAMDSHRMYEKADYLWSLWHKMHKNTQYMLI